MVGRVGVVGVGLVVVFGGLGMHPAPASCLFMGVPETRATDAASNSILANILVVFVKA
jgi:hypothetical protein